MRQIFRVCFDFKGCLRLWNSEFYGFRFNDFFRGLLYSSRGFSIFFSLGLGIWGRALSVVFGIRRGVARFDRSTLLGGPFDFVSRVTKVGYGGL